MRDVLRVAIVERAHVRDGHEFSGAARLGAGEAVCSPVRGPSSARGRRRAASLASRAESRSGSVPVLPWLPCSRTPSATG